MRKALDGADAVMLVTSWPQYKAVPALLVELDAAGVPVIDGRRLISPEAVAHYSGIGLSLRSALSTV